VASCHPIGHALKLRPANNSGVSRSAAFSKFSKGRLFHVTTARASLSAWYASADIFLMSYILTTSTFKSYIL
jgi:hypothetical protein